MKYLLYFALFGAAVFTACGDDSSNPVINEGTSSSFVFNRSSSSAVSSVPDGSFVDSRDGQVYKMVTIGNQVWMAQNLNFESPDSYCYEDKKDNCTKYGRLYKWSAAMDSAGLYSENGKGCGIVRPHILCLVFVLQDGIFLLKRNLKRCLKLLAENPLLEKNLRARRDGKRLFMTLMARMILVLLQFLLEAEEVMDLMDNWVLMETCGLLQKTSSRVHMVFSCLVRKIRQKLRDLILV